MENDIYLIIITRLKKYGHIDYMLVTCFGGIYEKNVVFCNFMIASYSQHGYGNQALNLVW